MALNFPSSPANNDIYYDTSTGNRYIYLSTISAWKYASNVYPAFDKANAANVFACTAYDLANAALPKWTTGNLTFDQSIALVGPNLSNTAGERIVIWPQRPSGAYYNYSIGLEHDAIWFGVEIGRAHV